MRTIVFVILFAWFSLQPAFAVSKENLVKNNLKSIFLLLKHRMPKGVVVEGTIKRELLFTVEGKPYLLRTHANGQHQLFDDLQVLSTLEITGRNFYLEALGDGVTCALQSGPCSEYSIAMNGFLEKVVNELMNDHYNKKTADVKKFETNLQKEIFDFFIKKAETLQKTGKQSFIYPSDIPSGVNRKIVRIGKMYKKAQFSYMDFGKWKFAYEDQWTRSPSTPNNEGISYTEKMIGTSGKDLFNGIGDGDILRRDMPIEHAASEACPCVPQVVIHINKNGVTIPGYETPYKLQKLLDEKFQWEKLQ